MLSVLLFVFTCPGPVGRCLPWWFGLFSCRWLLETAQLILGRAINLAALQHPHLDLIAKGTGGGLLSRSAYDLLDERLCLQHGNIRASLSKARAGSYSPTGLEQTMAVCRRDISCDVCVFTSSWGVPSALRHIVARTRAFPTTSRPLVGTSESVAAVRCRRSPSATLVHVIPTIGR